MTTKSDLLGETSPAIVVDPEKAAPFDPKEVLGVIKHNEEFSSVPCYCRECGITSYISQEEASLLMENNGLRFPEYEIGVYISISGCPHCTGDRGINPVVKNFDVSEK